jgi:RNA polymerase sigma-70 factor (ECF subfamily)
MEHSEILELYLKKDPKAIEESRSHYGYPCRRIAMNILAGEHEAEQCLSAALERAWDAIPPARPVHLDIYLLKLTRAVAMEGYLTSQSVKRGYNLFATVLDELGECRPSNAHRFSGGFDPEAEAVKAGECIVRFLRKQGGEARDLFLCRYFYAESLSEIARRFGLNENRVKSRLEKLRGKLRKFLEQEAGATWEPNAETLATGLCYVDDTLIMAAHGNAKKARRLIPWVAAACVVGALAVSFPYLRTVINTDLVLRGPDWNKEKDEIGDAEIAHKPSADQILAIGTPTELADSTLTLTAVTETTVTLTLVKTTSEPLYAAVYDRMGDALACTDPEYKVDGVTIRAGRIKVYPADAADGVAEPETVLPTDAGTYTVVIDFTSVRNGSYPMEEYLGVFAYSGKDGAPETVYFSLAVPEAEAPADTAFDSTADTEPDTNS